MPSRLHYYFKSFVFIISESFKYGDRGVKGLTHWTCMWFTCFTESCELVMLIPLLGKLVKYLVISWEQSFEENCIQISLRGDPVSPCFQNSTKAWWGCGWEKQEMHCILWKCDTEVWQTLKGQGSIIQNIVHFHM